jgi:hypothetical protein
VEVALLTGMEEMEEMVETDLVDPPHSDLRLWQHSMIKSMFVAFHSARLSLGLGGYATSEPVVAQNSDGRLQVFVIGSLE